MPQPSVSKGFTLIELLVSISIIGVITGLMMANFRGGQQSAEVRLASDILVGQIRGVQTSALTGRLVSVCSGGVDDLTVCEAGKVPTVSCGSGTCQRRVPAGYGIRFSSLDAENYTLFYDTDDDRAYDVGEELTRAPYVSTSAVLFGGSDVGDPVDLVFTPPFGKIYVNGSASGPAVVSLTLAHKFGTMNRHVKVFRLSGKVEHD